jgi:FAD/FMN-containing dehydrogenase
MTSLSTSVAEAVTELAKTFAGQLLQPTDLGYEEARRVHNGLVDKRPALIARCRGLADIADAVNLARTLNLEVAVRGGGHNVAGRATLDGGVMIDLSPMRGIHVDPKARTARAQGGVTWGEFNRETQLHGLATTGGIVSSTGIAGLTLGGGLGWLMGKYGLAVDNLLSVGLVTADGRVLRAGQDEHTDLFWAIRGAGANFGVVASLEYQLHPVGPTITGGLVAHPFERAREVLRFYRDITASLPDEFTVVAGLIHAPDGSGTKLVAILLCHCGPLDVGEAAARPMKAFGSPAMDTVGPLTYCQLNAMLDAVYPKGALNYWKSNFLAQLSDEAIDTMIECFVTCPSPMDHVVLEHMHGATTRVGIGDTAFPHRADGYDFLVVSEWMDQADTDRCIAWARDTYAAMKPFMASGRYVNYLDHDESGDPVAAAYGPNYRRLQELKAQYDPSNFFHMNQNIRPFA